jgi:hypothetical protein
VSDISVEAARTARSATLPDTGPTGVPAALLGLVTLAGLTVAVLALFPFGWLAEEMLEGDTLRRGGA